MTTEVNNGTAPLGPSLERAHRDADAARLDEDKFVRQLQEAIAGERVRRLDAEKLVAESKAVERRYQKALSALTGEPPAPPTPVTRHSRAKNAQDWQISPQKIEQVYQRVVELREQNPDRPLSTSWIADHTPGLSMESTRRAFEELRKQERLRIVGKVRGGGTRWDLMPDAVNA